MDYRLTVRVHVSKTYFTDPECLRVSVPQACKLPVTCKSARSWHAWGTLATVISLCPSWVYPRWSSDCPHSQFPSNFRGWNTIHPMVTGWRFVFLWPLVHYKNVSSKTDALLPSTSSLWPLNKEYHVFYHPRFARTCHQNTTPGLKSRLSPPWMKFGGSPNFHTPWIRRTKRARRLPSSNMVSMLVKVTITRAFVSEVTQKISEYV